MRSYPFLISVPHGGTRVAEEVRSLVDLSPAELAYYSDPATPALYQYRDRVASYCDTDISRMVVDLNRPPYHLPPRHPDGVVKTRTVDGTPVYRNGVLPDITIIHRLLMAHYFPYHAGLDRLLEPGRVALALDCHSMLPYGPPALKDAGRERPVICLGNNGDDHGRQRPGTLATCPEGWITALAASFGEEFSSEGAVSINTPFSGGFITNAHYWHKGIPWIQVEVNRSLYEDGSGSPGTASVEQDGVVRTGKRIWQVLCAFWDELGE